jgi:hypothetical protein
MTSRFRSAYVLRIFQEYVGVNQWHFFDKKRGRNKEKDGSQ